MGTRIGIIADDFTGANDSGVRLAQKGLKSRVILTDSYKQTDQDDTAIDVWIVDTNSRSMNGEDAYRAVFKEIEALKKRGVDAFYKKIDSTLRGSVAAELKAMQDATALDAILVAPAFPSMGRTVEGGKLYINGLPVTETEFSRDPKTPVLHDFLPDLLAMEGVKITVLDRTILYGETPEKWVAEQIQAGVNWIVCDVTEEADFPLLAALEAKLDFSIGWAGSAGMINHLYAPKQNTDPKRSFDGPIGKILIVSGSLSGKTQDQLAALEKRSATRMIEIDPLELLTAPARTLSKVEELGQPADWDSAALYVGGSQENRDKVSEWAAANALTAHQTSKGISEGLGHLVEKALAVSDFDAIIMTGGDTAKDICAVLGIHDMELLFEVEAGLPLGIAKWNKKDIVVITKAGGFGTPESISHSVDYLKGAGLHGND
ncbi:four-carbon acid sugar kinase family protein [Planococcus sp. 4-30]|uniref:four-carbon acid sugar kinase family protein n=1 Tax=Planococcus sp. 4-30 TaxID=2874583 RepID=UPI001CBE205A|nr:four-carbon acid sugar kinase family protein [Planococcus sp. 4-30]